MTTPQRGLLFHFAHVDNVASVARAGLLCDSALDATNPDFIEVANRDIKKRRRSQPVRAGPGGVVADYVPFYFAARSPMLYAIHKGRVRTYGGGDDELVYLVSSIEAIVNHRLALVVTDRNAALKYARHTADLGSLNEFVDWPLMEHASFANTSTELDRRERRMAELLVHRRVPWSAFLYVGAMSARAHQARTALASVGAPVIPVYVRRDWYF